MGFAEGHATGLDKKLQAGGGTFGEAVSCLNVRGGSPGVPSTRRAAHPNRGATPAGTRPLIKCIAALASAGLVRCQQYLRKHHIMHVM